MVHSHRRAVLVPIQAHVELPCVQTQLRRVANEDLLRFVRRDRRPLPQSFKDALEHVPKGALSPCSFGGLSGYEGLIMDVDQREVAEHDANAVSVLVLQTR